MRDVVIEKKDTFQRFLLKVEKVCNKLPDPFFLFAYILVAILLISAIFGGTTDTFSMVSSTGQVTETKVTVVNLLNVDYLRGLVVNMVKNYIGFAALGLVMVLMLALGVPQYSGLFDTTMKATMVNAPPLLLAATLAFVGANSSLASSAGIVLSTTLGASMFKAVGKNPIKGALIGYVASHGGWSACIFPFATDVLISGITETVARGVGIDAPIHPLMNYYYMVAFTFVVTAAITFVAEKLVPDINYGEAKGMEKDAGLTEEEKRGLRFAGLAAFVLLVILLILTVPKDAVLRNADGRLLPTSPLLNGIVGILFIIFVVVGAAYGYGAGTITDKKQIPIMMGYGIRDMIPFFVISFTACLCINAFDDSKLGLMLALKGANILKSMDLGSISLALGLLLLTCVVNLFITAVNIKWMILAPICVPMFASLGFSPALTSMIYRVGDSIVNPISPINLFFPIVVGIMNQYRSPEDPEIGIGTVISMSLPYVMVNAVVFTLMVIVWMLFDLPLGPGVTQMM
jgi:aminobenzoyl-glutamate transport protein